MSKKKRVKIGLHLLPLPRKWNARAVDRWLSQEQGLYCSLLREVSDRVTLTSRQPLAASPVFLVAEDIASMGRAVAHLQKGDRVRFGEEEFGINGLHALEIMAQLADKVCEGEDVDGALIAAKAIAIEAGRRLLEFERRHRQLETEHLDLQDSYKRNAIRHLARVEHFTDTIDKQEFALSMILGDVSEGKPDLETEADDANEYEPAENPVETLRHAIEEVRGKPARSSGFVAVDEMAGEHGGRP